MDLWEVLEGRVERDGLEDEVGLDRHHLAAGDEGLDGVARPGAVGGQKEDLPTQSFTIQILIKLVRTKRNLYFVSYLTFQILCRHTFLLKYLFGTKRNLYFVSYLAL